MTKPDDQPKTHAQSQAIYTIPASEPFLQTLAWAIINGELPRSGSAKPSDLDLARITLYMPTRRAARALSDAFLAVKGGGTMLLPTIRPISEGQEDLTLMTAAAELSSTSSAVQEIPPAVGETERRLALTELVLAWSRAKNPDNAYTPAQACHLASDLSRLMDLVETEAVSLDGLAHLAGDNLAEHWQETLQFLEIITQAWPAHLQELGYINTAARRNALILAESERLRSTPPKGPVIVAGVTGSIPATTQLMQVIGQLKNGAIVLPGLDTSLDEKSWQAIAPRDTDGATQHSEHPQYGFAKLLAGLNVSRGEVKTLTQAPQHAEAKGRLAFVSEAFRPTRTTGQWKNWVEQTSESDVQSALKSVSMITAPAAQDEAEAISLILRHAAETPGQTAALVSPDRMLARRVAIRLESWGIRVDDSAGRPFRKTTTGTLLDLVVDCIAKDFAPAETVALLKHPLTRLGLDAFTARRTARALELIVFRTTYLGSGIDGIEAALERRLADHEDGVRQHRTVQRLWDEDRAAARDIVTRLKQAYAPLTQLYTSNTAHDLRDLVEAHLRVGDGITKLPDEEAADQETSPLYQGEAGDAAAQFFTNMLDPSLRSPKIHSGEYADLYRSLIQTENVRPNIPVHPRLSIWGPYEARLQQPDVVILGSLNDGTWPEAADPGPWLNRPMREQLGLPAPEETLGRMAHDFTCLLGAKQVFLTRAEKQDGVPTVPSRWIMRIEALLNGLDLAQTLETDQPWLAWARDRDKASKRKPISAPEPKPNLKSRPRQMSVSSVEKWLSNPYAIFAQHILKLDALDPLSRDASASLKGSIVHEALARFAARYPSDLPDDIAKSLMVEANDVLTDYAADTRIAAFWIPRLQKFADWFATTEPDRRKHLVKTFAEQSGSLTFEAPEGKFKLSARADRIDYVAGDTPGFVITDYKTGGIPSKKDVLTGKAPQLPLEAAIADGDGYDTPPNTKTTTLTYISASGNNDAGSEIIVTDKNCQALAEEMLAKLKDLVIEFDNESTPYTAKRRRRFNYRYDDYAHLARVAEWSASNDGEGEGA